MENTAYYNEPNSIYLDDETVEQAYDVIKETAKSMLDISSETQTIISMTPRNGYEKKLELICSDERMSTAEKIEAINNAEDKYATDLERNAETCKGVMWAKAGLFTVFFVGSVCLISSPEGKKILKNVIRQIV